MKYTDLYKKELAEIQKAVPNLDKLTQKHILITGAGGLICSAIVDFLLYLNDTQQVENHIYVAARNYEKIQNRFGANAKREDFHFVSYDAELPIDSNVKFDYLIHGASNANPAAYVSEPVETMLANFIGMKNILDYARKNNHGRVVYVSSSEVYGKKEDKTPYAENDYAYVDILNPRACYPSSKRAAETLCAAYQKEYGIDFVVVRPGHIYGPTMTAADNRASSQFLRGVSEGKDIVMKSAGSQLRSYCHVLDCVSATITVMLNGEIGQAYNISNPNAIVTIREFAECCANQMDKKVIFDIPTAQEKAGYNMMDNSSLTSEKLESLGWKGLFDLGKGISETLNILGNNA